jgi:hypothetical protein
MNKFFPIKLLLVNRILCIPYILFYILFVCVF